MGQFEKDQNGLIIPCSSQSGLVDNLGKRVNERGYLIDEHGNIIDISGKQLWKVTDLKSGATRSHYWTRMRSWRSHHCIIVVVVLLVQAKKKEKQRAVLYGAEGQTHDSQRLI